MNPDCQKTIPKIINDASVIMFYLDLKGNISMCNKKAEEMLNRSREELSGKNMLDILYPDASALIKLQMFKAVLDDSVTYKRSSIFEGTIRDSAKIEHVISWNITPMLDESSVLEGILLLGNDVTLLKEREASVKKIDDTLRNILSSIKEYALYAANLEGNITYYGMGFESMFGWQKSEIVFKHVGLLHTFDDVTHKLPFILEQVRSLGQYELEIYLVKKNGESFPVKLSVSQFLDADAKPVGYIFIAKDITEEKKLEYQIFQSEKMSAVGKLAAGMAHEINNPLFVISGTLEMLFENKKLGKELRKKLTTIDNQAERIRKLVDRFLAFARKTSPNQENLDINKIIKNVLPLLSYHKMPSHKIRIVKEFAKKLSLVKGDAHQLQEVFINLFINACQAMPEGGKLSIKTSGSSGEFAQINITDTGSGITAENLKNLFLPFFSTKNEGTGLGLSICYNIIKNHHGTIEVESQIGKGTTFIIRIPFIKDTPR
ncbi:MAG: PAS domain S-box protein [Candidatus Omnitrophota bacterium]|nr:PAS domain S-box protein [Candidatus Omnitrophota bacterium]